MIVSNNWVRVTNTTGKGALVQKFGLVPLLVVYSELEPSGSEDRFVLRDSTSTPFVDAEEGQYIWVKAHNGSVSVVTTEVDQTLSPGDYSRQGGFIDYNDTSTTASPLVLADDVWVDVVNDGLGPFSNSAYHPQGIDTLMETPSGKFDLRQLDLGDGVYIRNDYEVYPDVDKATLSLKYSLGTGAGSYTLEKEVATLSRGAGIGYRQTVEVDYIYAGDTNTRDNLITLSLKLSGSSGTCVNYGSVIEVSRR